MYELNNLPKYENYIIVTDFGQELNVDAPLKYSEFPIIKNLSPTHKVATEKIIIDHIKNLKNSRVEFINGMSMSMKEKFEYQCSYCFININNNNQKQYYYCHECQTFMCHLCYNETSEEIAIKNESKNYNTRKDYLELCQKKHNLIKRNIKTVGHIGNEFGSMLDWIPIIVDKYTNMILMNLNPDSMYHKKFAFMIHGNHGRVVYNTIWEDITLEKILEEIEETEKKFENGLIISLMMKNRNMSTYYG